MHQSRSIVVFAALVLATACNKQRTEPQGTATNESVKAVPAASFTEPAAAAQTPTLARHMAEHFVKAAAMKSAVIRGDLEALRQDADWMAAHELSADLPESWRPHLQAMQTAAQYAKEAKDATAAARALADMGRACGTCHQALGGPKFEVGSPPAEGSGVELHMLGHQWAAERMWEGLIGPADAAWVKGAEVLARTPLMENELADKKSVPPEVELLAQQVHSFGEKGRAAVGGERAMLYAQFLATCASCHDKLGVKK